MVGRKKTPDDMELFRRKMGDVRPLKVEKRVPTQKSRTVKKPEPALNNAPVFVGQDSNHTGKCIISPEKRVYETLAEATSAAEFVKQEFLEVVRPYLCHSCGKFHLTSKQR